MTRSTIDSIGNGISKTQLEEFMPMYRDPQPVLFTTDGDHRVEVSREHSILPVIIKFEYFKVSEVLEF